MTAVPNNGRTIIDDSASSIMSTTASTAPTTAHEFGSDEEEVAWDIMDALYSRRSFDDDEDGSSTSISLRSALSSDLDAMSFGRARSSSTISSSVGENVGESEGDIEIPHFPPLSQALLDTDDGQPRTSEPIRPNRGDNQERALLAHVTRENFQQLVESPMGLARFREWIEEEGYAGSKACLQYYDDARAYGSFLNELAAATKAMQGVYFEPGSALSRTLTSRPSDCLPALGSVTLGISSAQTEALDRLYAAEFKRFIAGKITEHARARLGQFAKQQDRGDLGEVFCIANPNLPDQPLVMVSDGFCRLSEYPRDSLVGRNCRFLQGPATDPEAVRLLREAIAAGKEHCSLLLNYTRTGKPFWNLFNLIPLRNANGQIELFLGAQVDVSKAMTSKETFDALTGLAESGEKRATTGGANENFTFSEGVLRKMDTELERSTVLRQTPTIPSGASMRSPLNTFSPTFSSSSQASPTIPLHTPGAAPKSRRTSHAGKMLRLLSRASQQEQPVPMQQITSGPPKPISIVQQVPDSVREHMASFSSAYSKLLVVYADDRRVSYVTPPLLAELGYSVRTARDRLASSLLRKDLLDLIVGETSTETDSIRSTIRQVISNGSSHSLFAGVVTARDVRREKVSSLEESFGQIDGRSPTTSSSANSKERKFVRSLLHLTPVKGGKNDPVVYVVVVG